MLISPLCLTFVGNSVVFAHADEAKRANLHGYKRKKMDAILD